MKKIPLLCLALWAGWASSATAANADKQKVYDLAQGCYAIKSPATGKYMERFHKGGSLDDGLSYKFSDIPVQNATKFFFKPTVYSHYMMTDVDGRYLASHIPFQVSSGTGPGKFAEWRVDPHNNNGNYKFSFHGHGVGKVLRHMKTDGGLYFVNLLPPYNAHSETEFELVPQSGCTDFPEAELNLVRTDVPDNHPRVGDEVEGFVDPHTHLTSFEFMGGKFMHGRPFHKYGISHALGDSKHIHGPWGALDIIGNLMAYNDVNHRYDTRGYPDFPFWPNHKQISHQQSYYKWIERAHKAGLRVLVSHLVENEVLCNAQKTINPASWINPNSCVTTDSVQLQIQRLNEMQDYIDAQSGGPGKGFFRIVKSSREARQVISQGKLAVIMGMEVSEAFNCGLKDGNCTREELDRQLDNYYDQGVRVFYPVHRFDNKFGGTKIEDGFINVGQKLSTGHFFETKKCDFDVAGAKMTNGFPLIGKVPVLKNILDGLGLQPRYDESHNHCNQAGLTDLGVYLVNRMIDKKIMIEIDHMSPDTTDAVLKIAESRNYSGVITGHSHTPTGADGAMTGLQDRLAKLGGFMASYNFNAEHVSKNIDRYLELANKYNHYVGVGFSTDVNGIASQAAPRANNSHNGVQYPFTSFDGKYKFYKQKTGNRVFDYNKEGVAHYGMLADHIEDLKNAGTATAYESVMRSAEAYLQMWERSEQNGNGSYASPTRHYFSLVDGLSKKCMDIAGDDNNLHDNANVQMWDCQADARDQKWFYDQATGKLHNGADYKYCLDHGNVLQKEGNIKIYSCVDTPNQAFDFVNGTIRPRVNHQWAIDALGQGNGSNVALWSAHGNANQQWTKRTDNIDLRWVEYKDGRSGKCLDVAGGSSANETKVQLYQCNGTNAQQWFFDEKNGFLKSKVAPNKCLDVPGSNVNSGTQLIIYDCHGGNNQRFNRVGWSFRSRLNTGQILDAAGTDNGSPVIVHHINGHSNQSWYPSLP